MRYFIGRIIVPVIFILVMVLAIVSSAPAVMAQGDMPFDEEALLQGAKSYSAEVGTTVDESIRRLKLMHRVGALKAALEENESPTFGGVWIQHDPDFRIVVGLKGADYNQIRPYVAGGELEGVVEVRPVAATYAQLRAVQDEAIRTVDALGLPFDSGIRMSQNRAEILVTDRARLEAGLQAAGLRLPEHVAVLQVARLATTQSDFWAGWWLNQADGTHQCTTGFSVTNTYGTKGITTAAHCTEHLDSHNLYLWNGQVLPWKNWWYVANEPYDLQWHVAPQGYTPRPWATDNSDDGHRNVVGVLRDVAEQDYLCHYGRVSGYGCGWVTHIDWLGYGPGDTRPTRTFVRVYRTGDDLGTAGDSGSPWYTTGGYAVGIHHAGTDPDGIEGIYMPIKYVEEKGLTILTCSSFSPC